MKFIYLFYILAMIAAFFEINRRGTIPLMAIMTIAVMIIAVCGK